MSYQTPRRPEWLQWLVTISAFVLFGFIVVGDFKSKNQLAKDSAAYHECLKHGCPKAK